MPQKPRPWYRQQTGWWMAQVNRQQQKLVKGPKDAATRKLAKQKLDEILQLQRANPAVGSGRQTVASIIERYLRHAKNTYAERSLYERQLILQSFAEKHGWREVNDRDCLPYHITEWIDEHPEWKSDWTKAQVVAVVQRPFNWAAKERIIPANPFRGKTHRGGSPRRPMTDDEFTRLLAAARGKETRKKPTPGERFIELLRFLRATGCRPGEASKLRWEHVDCEGGVIVIPIHKTTRTQREKKPRVIILTPEVVQLLTEIRRRNEPGEYVFRTHRGTCWNRSNLSLRVQRAREKAGIPPDAKLYGLRHAFGTRAVMNGVDLKTLAELMGHTTTRMTEHYLHLAGQKAHLAAAMLRANGQSPAS